MAKSASEGGAREKKNPNAAFALLDLCSASLEEDIMKTGRKQLLTSSSHFLNFIAKCQTENGKPSEDLNS